MPRRHILRRVSLTLCLALPALGQSASAQAPVQNAPVQSNAQLYGTAADVYSFGVKVPANRPMYFSSGIASNPKDGASMAEQALASLTRLEANIGAAGFALSDVVFVRAYLRPGSTGAVDYAGWDKAWASVFAKAPVKPARTVVAMPLTNANSGLIEIEYVCVTKDPGKMTAASAALTLPVTNPNLKPFGTRDARIYTGMGLMPGSGLYWTAGLTAPVIDAAAPPSSYANRGDMYTQARNTLALMKTNLAQVGLTLADVLYVRAFVGPDHNQGGKFDTDAWNKAYGEFFNNPEQPHKPARVTMTTPTFAGNTGGKPISMIELEFVAAFPKAPDLFDGEEGKKQTRVYGAPAALFASGVAVKPGTSIYLSSSALPTVGGDMKTQALSALESLKGALAKAGSSFGDVVFLRAYLVPATDGSVDRDGWNQAYSTFFNNPGQPQKPARVSIPVISLPAPDAKIAIDVVAVAP